MSLFVGDKKAARMINFGLRQSKTALRPLPRWMQNFKSTGAGAFRYQANRTHGSFSAAGTKHNVLAREFEHHLLDRPVDGFRQFL